MSKAPTYPKFHAAHSLAKESGLTPSIQTLKRLEMDTKTVDPRPRPQKRRKVIDENEVDLYGSDYEDSLAYGSDYGDDILMEDAPSTSNKRYKTLLARNKRNANYIAAFEELTISPPSCASSIQNGKRDINSYLYPFARNRPLCFVLPGSNQEHQWILDSGASLHFTHDINDFVDYRLVKPIAISTATTFTNVVGKGTVILRVNGNAVRKIGRAHV